MKGLFNGRDQVTLSRQYSGTDTSSTFQDTTATFDGYGRLKTQHRPEQDANTATTYNYFADDRIQQVVDARGATINYVYDVRGLTTQVSTTSPNTATIPITPTVTMTYDNLGNRTTMTDGLGMQTYEYNQLSQLTAETRSFTDSLPNAPLANNSFRLEYGYSISGQLKSYKDPYGQQINYAFDKTGRLNTVTGSTAFGGVSTYANNPQYRAWGALKSLSYGDGMQMTTSFNNRLQAASYNLTYSNGSMMNRNYQYYADGGFKYMQDVLNPKFDRLQIYDHVGRVSEGKSGAEARGQTAAQPLSDSLPYRQSYQYNPFGQMTQRNNLHWGKDSWDETFNLSYYFNNNRDGSWSYDADGNALAKGAFGNGESSIYDATGQITKMTAESTSTYPHTFPPTEDSVTQIQKSETYRFYGGNGELKRIERSCVKNANLIAPCTWTDEPPRYFVRSSVFGNEPISEVNSIGKKLKTYIKAAGQTLAWQALTHKHPSGTTDYNPPLEAVYFERYDASGMSRRTNNAYGPSVPASENDPVENDPLGGNVGTENPYNEEASAPEGNGECKNCDFNGNFELQESSLTKINGQQVRCKDNGITVPCAQVRRELESGRRGGALGALEYHAKLSTLIVGYNVTTRPLYKQYSGGPPTLKTTPSSGGSAPYQITSDEREIAGSIGVATPIYYDNWSLNSAMIPAEQKTQTVKFESLFDKGVERRIYANKTVLENDYKGRLALKNGNETCGEKLDKVLGKLNPKLSSFQDLADKFIKGGEYKLEETINPITKLKTKQGAIVNAPIGLTKPNHIIINSQTPYHRSVEGETFIHEVLHSAGINNTFQHQQIALKIAEVEGINLRDYLKKNNFTNNKDWGTGFIDSWIKEFCSKEGGPNWEEWLKKLQ